MRRAILLLAAMGTALLLSSGVALALNIIRCGSEEPCHGTDRPDLMKGTDGFNFMLGHGNDDALKGFGRSDDRLRGEEAGDEYSFESAPTGGRTP